MIATKAGTEAIHLYFSFFTKANPVKNIKHRNGMTRNTAGKKKQTTKEATESLVKMLLSCTKLLWEFLGEVFGFPHFGQEAA